MQRMEMAESAGEVKVLAGYPGLVLRLPPNVDVRNAEALRSAILDAWSAADPPRRVVVDLSETQHLDSSGVGLLLEFSKKASEDGVELSLCGLRTGPRRLLERTHILEQFAQCEWRPFRAPAAAPLALRRSPAQPIGCTAKYGFSK